MSASAFQHRNLFSGCRFVNTETSVRVVHVEKTTGDDWTRSAFSIFPHLLQPTTVESPRRRTAIVGGEEPGGRPDASHCRRSEQICTGRSRHSLHFPTEARHRAPRASELEHS